MNFRHPMRFFFSSAVCLLLLAGCAGRSLEDVADESSLARFRALPADAEVLVSLHGEGLAEHFTGTRPVGALGEARLVMAPHGALKTLSNLEGLQRVVVWGDDKALQRLDPLLRLEMLGAMDTAIRTGKTGAEIRAVASFDEGARIQAAELQAMGLALGSHTGQVATVRGTCANLLDLAAHPQLVKLEKPALQFPTSQSGRIEP